MVDPLITSLLKNGEINPLVAGRHDVIVGIPAFNEEKNIAGVILQSQKYSDLVVVCDDGSKDMTSEIAERLGAHVVRHDRNLGYGATICTLFGEAKRLGADVLVTLDGDSQHDPMEIPRLVEKLTISNADIVIGSRFLEGGSSEAPGWRKIGIRLINRVASNGGVSVSDAQSGFRAYSRRAIEALTLTEDGMGVSTEILLKAERSGLRIMEVPINVSYDEYSSSINPVEHGFNVILSTLKYMSMKRPLLSFGLPGLFFMLLGMFFFVWTFQVFAETRSVSTNIALIAVFATMVGLTLILTAMILWVIINVVRENT